MTMIKTLALAAFTALTLSAGAAFAQEGPSGADNYLPASPPIPVHPAPGVNTWSNYNQAPQAGSSDVSTQARPAAPGYDYGDLANPG